MKVTLVPFAALLALSACKKVEPPATPPPAPVTGTALKAGDYWCYGAGGVVFGNQGFRVTGAGKYQDIDGRNPGTFTVIDGQVAFTGGHFDKSTGRNLHDDTFRIGTAMECAPTPTTSGSATSGG